MSAFQTLRWARKRIDGTGIHEGSQKRTCSRLFTGETLKPFRCFLKTLLILQQMKTGSFSEKFRISENLGYSCDVQAFHAFDFGVLRQGKGFFLLQSIMK